jgi:DNA repair protein RadC
MKPREKLKEKNIKALDDDELIALILGRGNKTESVFQCARRMLERFDHEELANTRNVDVFSRTFGTGPVQSAQMMAAFELGRRFFQRQGRDICFRTSEQVYRYAKNMENLRKEHLKGLYLDSRYRLVYEETLSIGGLNSVLLHPREVFRPAFEHNAYAVILVHNHPSGDPTPSADDRTTMEKLIQASEIVQIPLLDHIVIGKTAYKSLKKG